MRENDVASCDKEKNNENKKKKNKKKKTSQSEKEIERCQSVFCPFLVSLCPGSFALQRAIKKKK